MQKRECQKASANNETRPVAGPGELSVSTGTRLLRSGEIGCHPLFFLLSHVTIAEKMRKVNRKNENFRISPENPPAREGPGRAARLSGAPDRK